MTCEKCGLVLPEDAIRTHEGHWLCHMHKVLYSAGPLPQIPVGLDVAAALDSVASRFAAFTESQSQVLQQHAAEIAVLLAQHRVETSTRHAQLDTHETRLAAAEASLGTARDILGDVSTRGDVTAQIGTLAAEIAALKDALVKHSAARDVLMRDIVMVSGDVDSAKDRLDAFILKTTFWQRLRWLLLGR